MKEYQIEVGDAFFDDSVRKMEKKGGEVVMVFLRPGNKALLSTKEFYPQGTYRLPTGSMDKGEAPEDALVREAREETGFDVTAERKLGAIHWVFKNGDRMGEYYSHIFVVPETTDEPVPEDHSEQITGYREMPVCDLKQVGEELMTMQGRWNDWGRFRGLAHLYVHELLCAQTA